MEACRCAFSHTLITSQFGCEMAQQVTRRGGPDIACTAAAAHRRCEQLFERMKTAALPAFGVEDDLLSMPHSVLVKIQFGGLLGLQRLVDGATVAEVKNIHALAQRAASKYGDLEAVPCSELVPDMTGYKLRRRG